MFFLTVPLDGLLCVIVVFPDHAHLLLDPFLQNFLDPRMINTNHS